MDTGTRTALMPPCPPAATTAAGSGSAALPYDACHDFTPMVKTDVPQVAGFHCRFIATTPGATAAAWARLCGARQLSTPANMAGYIHRACWAAFCHQTACYSFVYRKTGTWHWCWKNVRASPRLAAVVGEGPAPDFTASRRLTPGQSGKPRALSLF